MVAGTNHRVWDLADPNNCSFVVIHMDWLAPTAVADCNYTAASHTLGCCHRSIDLNRPHQSQFGSKSSKPDQQICLTLIVVLVLVLLHHISHFTPD